MDQNLEKRLKRQVIGKPHRFLAVVPLGFEQTFVRESQNSFPFHVVGDGKVEFTAKLVEAWKIAAYSRIANRVLMEIAQFNATNFGQLEKHAAEIPWELFLDIRDFPSNSELGTSNSLQIHVTCKHSRLYHSDAVAERLYNVIGERLHECRSGAEGDRVKAEDFPQNLYVTLIDDRCTLWLDLAGEELYKRGHQRFVNDAPLKETIAAGMILEILRLLAVPSIHDTKPDISSTTLPSHISHSTSHITLIDPMAGSGTFSLEAAYMAGGLIPGKCRDFALKHQPAFKPATWKHIVFSMDSLAPTGLWNNNQKAHEPTNVTPKREAQVCPIANIITSDISEKAINIIRHNIECSPLAQSPTREPHATGAHSLPTNNSANSAINIDPQLRDFFTYTAKEIAEACRARNDASIPATRDKHATASNNDKHATRDIDTQPVIVLNPPYGKRLDFDAPALYARIGKKLAELARELEPFGKKLTVAILTPNDAPRTGSKFTCTANLLRDCPALDPAKNASAKRIATSHGGLGLGAFIAQI